MVTFWLPACDIGEVNLSAAIPEDHRLTAAWPQPNAQDRPFNCLLLTDDCLLFTEFRGGTNGGGTSTSLAFKMSMPGFFLTLPSKLIEFFDSQPCLTNQFSKQARTKFIMPSHLPSPLVGEGEGEGGIQTRRTKFFV